MTYLPSISYGFLIRFYKRQTSSLKCLKPIKISLIIFRVIVMFVCVGLKKSHLKIKKNEPSEDKWGKSTWLQFFRRYRDSGSLCRKKIEKWSRRVCLPNFRSMVFRLASERGSDTYIHCAASRGFWVTWNSRQRV